MDQLERYEQAVRSSSLWQDQIQPLLAGLDGDVRVVCLGLGSPTESKQAMYQLALMKCISEKGRVWDPVLTAADLQLIEQAGYTVSETLGDGETSGETSGDTVYYLPHFPIDEMEKFLHEAKPRLLLGNDLTEYTVKLSDEKYYQQYPLCSLVTQLINRNSADKVTQDGSDGEGFSIVKSRKSKRKNRDVKPAQPVQYNFDLLFADKVKFQKITCKDHSKYLNSFTDLAYMELTSERDAIETETTEKTLENHEKKSP